MVKALGITRGATVGRIAACLGARRSDPGFRGLAISEVLEPMVRGIDADAIVELWWEGGDADAAALEAAADLGGTWWRTTEHVYRARPNPVPGPRVIKVVGTAYRRHDFSVRAFFDYWRDVHGPISAAAPGLGAYVVSEVLQRLAGDLEADGFVEQWWPDRATLDGASASPEVAIAWEDVRKYAKPAGTFWITREHVLVPTAPDAPGTLER